MGSRCASSQGTRCTAFAFANATSFALASSVTSRWFWLYAAALPVTGSISSEYGKLNFPFEDISFMTNLIHIVGPQGIGKSSLALDIIAGLERRGKTSMVLNSDDLRFGPAQRSCKAARAQGAMRPPFAARGHDAVIIEHEDLPTDIDAQPGDLVIRMERPA